jgi:sensor histidine kinase YesM
MHPLLRTPKQFLIIGFLWLPLCVWVAFLLNRLVNVSLWDACVWVGPPMAVELFICLSTWYICKITSLKQWNLVRTIGTHIIAAGILSAFWLLLILLYTEILVLVFKTNAWHILYQEALPIFFAVGVSLYFIAILGNHLMLAVEKNRKTEQEILKHKLLASQAELKALKATVHPHFLFNCLNLLGPLMRTSITQAQIIISQLSNFLLYSLRYGKQEWVTIQDELDHVKNYLGIESVRLGSRLNLQFDIDESILGAPVLPLTLLPLVENAIKHGIGQCLEGGTLSISIKKVPDDGNVHIEITNPFDEPSQPAALRGEGLGLRTLKQRISAYYGPHGQLITWKDNKQFKVKLSLPQGEIRYE